MVYSECGSAESMLGQGELIDTKWAIELEQQGIGVGSGIAIGAQRMGVDVMKRDSASQIEQVFGPIKEAERCFTSSSK